MIFLEKNSLLELNVNQIGGISKKDLGILNIKILT